MSKMSSLVLGVVGGAAMFGAIQYASGNDLRKMSMDHDAAPPAISSAPAVNRIAKGDRASSAARIDHGQTLSFQVYGLSDTSVLLRLAGPAPEARSDKTGAKANAPDGDLRKTTMVACEPPVSMLTEIAKLLQPGRCVT